MDRLWCNKCRTEWSRAQEVCPKDGTKLVELKDAVNHPYPKEQR
jgi:hypothetical protein